MQNGGDRVHLNKKEAKIVARALIDHLEFLTYVEAYNVLIHEKEPEEHFLETLDIARNLCRRLIKKLNLEISPFDALLAGLIEKVPKRTLKEYAEKWNGEVDSTTKIYLIAYYFLERTE